MLMSPVQILREKIAKNITNILNRLSCITKKIQKSINIFKKG